MTAPATASDRNLLFGLLTLQMDFVTQQQLLEAMQAWLLEKQTPLGEILVRKGFLDEDDRADVEKLLSKHVKRHGGDVQASIAALRVEDAVRASLAELSAEFEKTPAPATVASSAISALATIPPTVTLPGGPSGGISGSRYFRLRSHARGGLGEVSVARDEELGREVALKEIQERFADHPDSRARFVREARITGYLEHPGVVPVYGLGVYPDGRPYYAMRFIKGESMQEAIARFHEADGNGRDPGERSLALCDLLGRFLAVSDAVAYAHDRGVIHRDLKPANVMLGEYGETLVVDWGLARRLDQAGPEEAGEPDPLSANGGSTATEQGQAVGTPPYMAPEQASGEWDRVGPASDVFSLGAVLYQLLTGVPPYTGASAYETLEMARKGQVTAARRRKAEVPRALEAVCARALAASPGERYADARALAADVRRWLAGEPVSAYPEPISDRVRRWGRRNRSVVSAGVVLLLAGVVSSTVGLILVNRQKAKTDAALIQARDNLTRAEAAEERALANLARAEENLTLARTAIDECYNAAMEDPLFQGPRMEKPRKLLLSKTLPFYKKFRAQRADDRGLQEDEAWQWMHVAHVEHALGNTNEAKQAREKTVELFAALVQKDPTNPAYRRGLAGAHGNLGTFLMEQRLAGAEKHLLEGRDLLAALVKEHPESVTYLDELGSAQNNLGNLLSEGNGQERARARIYLEEACQARRRLRLLQPEEHSHRGKLATSLNNLALLLGRDQGEAARKHFEEACQLQEEIVRQFPKSAVYVHELARSHHNLGALLADQGKPKDAQANLDRARQLRTDLVKENPDVPGYRHEFARTYYRLGMLLKGQNKPAEALEAYREAAALQTALAEEHPDVPDYKNDLATTLTNTANLLVRQGDWQQALPRYEKAIEVQEALVKQVPSVPRYRLELGRMHNALGYVLAGLGKRPSAQRHYDRAIELQTALVESEPRSGEYRHELARTLNNSANLSAAQGKTKESLALYERAREIQAALVEEFPSEPEYANALATTHNNLAIQHSAKDAAKSHEHFQRARTLLERLVKQHPTVLEYASVLASTRQNLGILTASLNRPDEAGEHYRAAIRLLTDLVEANPKAVEYRSSLASSQTNLGLLLADQKKTDEARRCHQAARELHQGLVRADPKSPRYRIGLGGACCNLGNLLNDVGETKASLECYDQAVEELNEAVRLVPADARASLFLRNAYWGRARARTTLRRDAEADADWDRAVALTPAAQRTAMRFQRAHGRASAGDYLRAADEADQLSANDALPGSTLCFLASIQAYNAHHAARDADRPLPEREKRGRGYGAAALALLKRAADAGFFRDPMNLEWLLEEKDLAPLRQRDDFRAFVASLKSK